MSTWTQLELHHKYRWAFYTDLQKIGQRLNLKKTGLATLRDEVIREMDLLVELEHHGWFIEELTEGTLFVELEATVAVALEGISKLSADAQTRLMDGIELFAIDMEKDPATGSVFLRFDGTNLYANATPRELAYKRREASTLPWDASPESESRKVTLFVQDHFRDVVSRLGFSDTEADIALSYIANMSSAEVSGHPVDLVQGTLRTLEEFLPENLSREASLEARTHSAIDALLQSLASGRRRQQGAKANQLASVASESSPLVKQVPIRNTEPSVGRNAPCPCGSGKKYKKCCGQSA